MSVVEGLDLNPHWDSGYTLSAMDAIIGVFVNLEVVISMVSYT